MRHRFGFGNGGAGLGPGRGSGRCGAPAAPYANPVGLAKQLAGTLEPISKGEVAGSEGREPPAKRHCVWGRPQLLQPLEQVVSTWGGGEGEKEVPGNRWHRQGWGFQTRGWGGGWPSAPGGRWRAPPLLLGTLAQRKELGEGEGCFYSD